MTGVYTETDKLYLARAIELAANGTGSVKPNPVVGAVIARDEEILGEGWHERYGAAHAEVNAIEACGMEDLSDATLYVSLEPCCHEGKTPPCTEAILQAGIKRVVIGSDDPTEKASGRSLGILRASPDARPAGPADRPGRVVCDSLARRPPASKLVAAADEIPLTVVVSRAAARADTDALEAAGAQVLVATGENEPARVRSALDQLGAQGVASALLEGGPRLAGAFLDAGEGDGIPPFPTPPALARSAAPGPAEGPG